ncbi:hypothetical protein D3C73_1615570 [compost metagenome]
MNSTGWCARVTTPASTIMCTRLTASGTFGASTSPAFGLMSEVLLCRYLRSRMLTPVALISTAMAAFQPKWLAM